VIVAPLSALETLVEVHD